MFRYPVCSDCNGDDFREHHGDLVCTSCGLVHLSHMIDERAEWRTFEDGEDRSRVGEHPVDTRGQVTKIGQGGQSRVLNRVHARITLTKQEGAKAGLHIMAGVLGLQPNTIRLAQEMLEDAAPVAKGQGAAHVTYAACAYLACKLERTPRPAELFHRAFNVPSTKFHRACNEILNSLSSKPYFKRLLESTMNEDLLTRMVHQVDAIIDADFHGLGNLPLKGVANLWY